MELSGQPAGQRHHRPPLDSLAGLTITLTVLAVVLVVLREMRTA